jgi:hypothetical protein
MPEIFNKPAHSPTRNFAGATAQLKYNNTDSTGSQRENFAAPVNSPTTHFATGKRAFAKT